MIAKTCIPDSGGRAGEQCALVVTMAGQEHMKA